MSHSFKIVDCDDYIKSVVKGDSELEKKIKKALLDAHPKTVEEVDSVVYGVIGDHYKEGDEVFVKGLRRPFVV